jgi:hypothetical protein
MARFGDRAQRIGPQEADETIVQPIAPGPAILVRQQRETLAMEKLRTELGLIGRIGAKIRNGYRDPAFDGCDIVGQGQPVGERDIGAVAAKGVDARIERRRAAQGKAETRGAAGFRALGLVGWRSFSNRSRKRAPFRVWAMITLRRSFSSRWRRR